MRLQMQEWMLTAAALRMGARPVAHDIARGCGLSFGACEKFKGRRMAWIEASFPGILRL
jgi:hypothetical protein